MVDDFDGDAAASGLGEGAGHVAVEAVPGFFVDLGFQGGFEALVGIVGAKKIGLADEEALFVVVGVDEPTGDPVGSVAANFACAGLEDVDAVDLDFDIAQLGSLGFGLADRGEERRNPPRLLHALRRLPAGIQLPMFAGVLVRRIQDRIVEKLGHRRPR